jgi:hypothetical protein
MFIPRNLREAQETNTGDRALHSRIVVKEVEQTLSDWLEVTGRATQVVVGDLAFSYWCLPKLCLKLEFLFQTDVEVPIRPLANFDLEETPLSRRYVHSKTSVPCLPFHGTYMNAAYATLPVEFLNKLFDTAHVTAGVRIAQPEALICMKGMWLSHQSKADISTLCGYLGPLGLPDRIEPWLQTLEDAGAPLRSFLTTEGWINGNS